LFSIKNTLEKLAFIHLNKQPVISEVWNTDA